MNSPLSKARYIPPCKGKTQHQPKNNRVGKQMATGNQSNRGEEGAPRPWQPLRAGCGSHHGPWWTPRSARGAHLPEVFRSPALLRFGASFWLAGFFPWII